MKKLLIAILAALFACAPALLGACHPVQHTPGEEKLREFQGERETAEQEENSDSRTIKEENISRRIWLTFDDGPTDSTTPAVLDILREKNVKATFFVIGRQINGREKILRREADEGHTIGIHTYSHEYKKIYATADSLLKDIALCNEAIRGVLPDFKTDLYRFPGGSYNVKRELIDAVEKAGFRHYDGNCSAEDAVCPNTPASVLYQNVLDSAGEKSKVILLMHDGVGYKETIKCLPSVIEYFREKEFAFCTL